MSLLCWSVSVSAASVSEESLGHEWADRHQLVVITAEQASAHLSISDVTLMAVRSGRLESIPFQIDEVDQEGFVYFSETGIPHSGLQDVWDGLDELVFMLKDASPERLVRRGHNENVSSGAPGAVDTPVIDADIGKVLAEVSTEFNNGVKGYVYLVQGEPSQGGGDYVRYDREAYVAESDWYRLTSRADNPIELQDLSYRDDRLPEASLLDTVKMWITGHSVGGVTQMTITNRNFRAEVVDVKAGAIRANVQLKAQLSVAKIPIMNFWIKYQFTPSGLRAVSRAEIPNWMPMFLYRTSVGLSMDANDLRGSQVYAYSDSDQLLVGEVDGELSRAEVRMQSAALSSENPWWMLVSPRNFQVLARMKIPTQYETPINLIYQDDVLLKVSPERYVGQLPNIGFQVSRIPLKGVYTMVFDLYFDNVDSRLNPRAYVESKLTPTQYDWRWLTEHRQLSD